jgi:HEAT repeat protein
MTICLFLRSLESMRRLLLVLLLGMVLAGPALAQTPANNDNHGKDVDSLIKDLKNVNSTVRANAAKSLGLVNDTKGVSPLISALKDENSTVRMNAAESLGISKDERAVYPLIEALGDRDIHIGWESAVALVKIGEPAIDPLIQALEDNNAQIRANAAMALGQFDDSRAVEPLIQALRAINDTRAIIQLVDIVEYGKNLTIRKSAANALRKIGTYGLKDENSTARWMSAYVLGYYFKDKSAVESLIQALEDNQCGAACAADAAKALGNINDTRVVEPLIQALNNNDSSVRYSAAMALGKVKDTRAVEPLIHSLKEDEDEAVRSNAAEALGKHKDARAVEPLIQGMKDNYSIVRVSAAIALGQLNDTRAIGPLVQALQDNSSSVWAAANKSLAELGWHPATSSQANVISESIATKPSSNTSSIEDSKAVLDKAANAIESQDKKAFLETISNETLTLVSGEPDLSTPEAAKMAKGLKEARVVNEEADKVSYEMTIDGSVYSFYTIKEEGAWKISGL